eukprot:UN19274
MIVVIIIDPIKNGRLKNPKNQKKRCKMMRYHGICFPKNINQISKIGNKRQYNNKIYRVNAGQYL